MTTSRSYIIFIRKFSRTSTELVSEVLGQERLNTTPDQLISSVTEELFGLRVNPYDHPILSDDDDGISYRLQNGAGIEETVKAVRTVNGLFLGSLKPGGLRLRSHHRLFSISAGNSLA